MKKQPLRKCSGCGEMKPKRELMRVVRAPQKADAGENKPAEISLDLSGKMPGRGAYLCKSTECFEKARKARRFERSLSCQIPAEVYEQMKAELETA
jgi:predicted RNA-binding protein YlxR (DUF448 family)